MSICILMSIKDHAAWEKISLTLMLTTLTCILLLSLFLLLIPLFFLKLVLTVDVVNVFFNLSEFLKNLAVVLRGSC